jgi:hypothetical protein
MKNLCRTIIWNACFLELSGDDVIDPDSSVRALEDMAVTLQEATVEEKAAFAATCSEEAAAMSMKHDPASAKTAEFIRGLPESLGL